MSQSIEKRLTKLERKVVELSTRSFLSNRRKDWRRTIGIFRNDPDFEQAVRLGRQYREKQTCAKEFAVS